MSIRYSDAVKHTRMGAVITALNGGKLVLGTSSLSHGTTGVLVSIPLASPCASDTNGVTTFNTTGMSAEATDSGIAARAELRSAADVWVGDALTVGLSSADIVLGTVNINIGNTVVIRDAVLTHG